MTSYKKTNITKEKKLQISHSNQSCWIKICVWRRNSKIFELIKPVQLCVYVSIALLLWQNFHDALQSLNSNTRVDVQGSKVTSKTKLIVVVHLTGLNKLYTLLKCFYGRFFKKQVNVHCGIGSISMPIASHMHNAANHVIAKNNCQRYFKKFEVLFSRK